MKPVLAPIIFSSVLFAAMFSRRTSAATPARRFPAPSLLPPLPPDPPWALPPLPPQTVAVKAGHRYEVVADVQAAQGVGITSAADKIIQALKLDDPSVRGIKNLERPGVGTVTRATLRVTTLVDGVFPLEQKLQTPGVGSCWIVSIKEVAP